METLLGWVNARTIVTVAALAVAASLGVTFREEARELYEHWRYVSVSEKTPLAAAIEQDLEARASLKLKVLHREVSAEIARAVAEGFDVGPLQATVDGILKLDNPAQRAKAVDYLQKLRLSIPKKRQKLKVAADETEAETPPPSAAKADPRARRRRR